jgi:hypothetical protein
MLIRDVEQFATSCCQRDTEDPDLSAHVQLVRKFTVRLPHIEHATREERPDSEMYTGSQYESTLPVFHCMHTEICQRLQCQKHHQRKVP